MGGLSQRMNRIAAALHEPAGLEDTPEKLEERPADFIDSGVLTPSATFWALLMTHFHS